MTDSATSVTLTTSASVTPTTSGRHAAKPKAAGAVLRVGVVGALALGGALLSAAPAVAHVSIETDTAEQGGYDIVRFSVPNEHDRAATVKLEVVLPADHPLASARPQPVPGWKVEVTTGTLDRPLQVHGKEVRKAPTKITWSGGRIGPGTFQQFPVFLGPLPQSADQLIFKTLQTYDNDEVLRWTEEPRTDGGEVASPAPVLQLVPARDGHAPHAGAGGHARGATGRDPATDRGDTESFVAQDTTARALGALGVLVGLTGVTFGVVASRRARS